MAPAFPRSGDLPAPPDVCRILRPLYCPQVQQSVQPSLRGPQTPKGAPFLHQLHRGRTPPRQTRDPQAPPGSRSPPLNRRTRRPALRAPRSPVAASVRSTSCPGPRSLQRIQRGKARGRASVTSPQVFSPPTIVSTPARRFPKPPSPAGSRRSSLPAPAPTPTPACELSVRNAASRQQRMCGGKREGNRRK